MISILKAAERHHNEEDWLSTYWHFSFSNYHDPKNMGWGALRVFNDDTIAPGGTFPMHPHANFEIITIVLEGEITHEDSAGNKGTVREHEVQAMTAGSGLFHSETNSGGTPLHLLQIWLEPSSRGLPPAYAQASFSPDNYKGKLFPLVSGKTASKLKISQDAAIYRCTLSKNETFHYAPPGKHNYIYVISGTLLLNGSPIGTADSAKIKDEKKLTLSTESSADFLLFDLP